MNTIKKAYEYDKIKIQNSKKKNSIHNENNTICGGLIQYSKNYKLSVKK